MTTGMDAGDVCQPDLLNWQELGARIVRAAFVATTCELCIRSEANPTELNQSNSLERAA